jgi:zinc protease
VRLWRLLPVLLLPLPCAAVGPQVAQRALPNGATLLVSEQHGLPIVQVTAILDAGSRRDPEGAFGLANLTADTLTEGAGGRSANEIAAAIELIGGGLSANAGVDYATVSVRVLRKDLDTGLELLADVLLEPEFPADELERGREATLAALRAVEDDSTEVANREFSRALYGPHPYAHPVEGEPASVAAISTADLRRFYEAHYVPERSALVVVGDVEVDDIERRLAAALAAWPARPLAPLVDVGTDSGAARRIEIDRPVTQAGIVMGHRGVPRSSPDFEAIEVMNYVLGGGGFSSRLMEKIRNRAGLVYSVSSYFSGGELPGSFRVIMQTKNESVAEAIALARAEIEAMRADGITAAELEDAKRYLTGSFPLSLDSNAEIAAFLARAWFLGLGPDAAETYLEKIEAVSREDVRRVAATHLRPEDLLVVVVADLAKAKGAAAAPQP